MLELCSALRHISNMHLFKSLVIKHFLPHQEVLMSLRHRIQLFAEDMINPGSKLLKEETVKHLQAH